MIVIPMAGASSRFTAAGYTQPKYMLPLGGSTVFDNAVRSFSAYFASERFLFVLRDVAGSRQFVTQSCAALGVQHVHLVTLDEQTTGQAETVDLGLVQAQIGDREPITIFNIDTFRPGFRFPKAQWWSYSDGYLEVFQGSGMNWSYVRTAPGDPATVIETAEKRPISNLCCTGLYHFAAAGDFRDSLVRERSNPTAPELYVAPLYNHLIAAGRRIHCTEVNQSEIIFCGVPAEYSQLLTSGADQLLASPSHNPP